MFKQGDPRGHRLPPWFEAPGSRAGWHGRAGRRIVVVVVIGAFALSLIAAAAGRPPALIPQSGAERFVASDAHREILAGATVQVRQTGHQPGNRPWTDGPWWFFLGSDTAVGAGGRYWIVETEDDSAGDTPHLMLLDETGLSTDVAGWPDIRHFKPARPEIPAHPRPGQRIVTTGQTTSETFEESAYTSVLEVSNAAATGPGCLAFRRTDTIGAAAPVTSVRVRCPGRGVVRLELPAGRWERVPEWPAGIDPRSTVSLAEPPTGPLRGLSPSPIVFHRGELGQALVSAAGPLLSVGGHYVLPSVSTGHLLWLTKVDQRYEMTAWVDAGGDIAGVAACGEVVVAATTLRTVIAHDDEGRWLWTTELDDVAGSHPVRAGDSILVATKDGALTALGCRDGAVRWQTDGVGSTVPPAVGAAGILAAGESSVRLLDPVSGEQRWERDLPGQPYALGFLGSLAVAADSADYIHGVAGPDGASVWTHRLVNSVVELHGLDEVLVVRTNDGFVGIDRHGQRQWQHDFVALDSLSDGRSVLAANLQEVVVIDTAGRTVDRTPGVLHQASAQVFLAHTPTGVTAADAMGTHIDWHVT